MFIMNTYARLPITITKGQGCYVEDEYGKQYLDALSGIGTCCLGHAHPVIAEAISDQASKLIHCSNLYSNAEQNKLAKVLVDISGLSNCFFSNSGAEANETAIKLARFYGHKKGVDKPQIIVFDGAFHGRTMATLTATANRKIQAGFEPLVQGFIRSPFNDIESVKAIASNNQNVVAVLIEPILGEGGVRLADEVFLMELKALCEKNDWLMMLDEVQTGNFRTAKYFAFQHYNFKPDVLTTAKGLGNGVPIGACLAGPKAAELFGPGNHGTTFGGNPLVCRVALEVIKQLQTKEVMGTLAERSDYLFGKLNTIKNKYKQIIDLRGKGFMLGIELDCDCKSLEGIALEKGLLLNVTADKVVRLLPPLIMSKEEINLLCYKLEESLKFFFSEAKRGSQ